MLRRAPWPRLVGRWRRAAAGDWAGVAPALAPAAAFAADAAAAAAASAAANDSDTEPLSRSPEPRLIRNVAVIAHVDHGKTTLMDALLRFCERQQQQQQQEQPNAAATPPSSPSSSPASTNNTTNNPNLSLVDRAMDNLALERERGITILAKTTSLRHRGHVVNAVDTPGHADFSGEVERALRLVDGCLLLVDAVEGPQVQTKFVLAKALRRGLRPLVVLSRADRPEATPERCGRTASAAFDLFAQLGASDEQLDFPVLLASGRGGWARRWTGGEGEVGGGGALPGSLPSMAPLLDAILEQVPSPLEAPPPFPQEAEQQQQHGGDPRDAPFAFAIAMIERDPYVGRVATGRVVSGRVRVGDRIRALRWAGYRAAAAAAGAAAAAPGSAAAAAPSSTSSAYVTDNLRVTRLEKRAGVGRAIPLTEASAGDVVLLAGAGDSAGIGDTVAAPSVARPLDPGPIDPPTLAMVFSPNDSPFAGRSGKAVTGRALGERLAAEAEASVSLEVRPAAAGGGDDWASAEEDEGGGGGSSPGLASASGGERHVVRARGELQLGVLLEGMRREGLELAVSPPAVVMRRARGGAGGGAQGAEGAEGASGGGGGHGAWLEPVEEVRVEVPSAMAGSVIEALTARRADLLETEVVAPLSPSSATAAEQRTVLAFEAPSRGLIGFRAAFSAMTRGEGVLQRQFCRYAPHKGDLQPGARRKAVLVSTETGRATAYALHDLLPRARNGVFFVAPGEEVYCGQVIAEASRDGGGDMDVNPTRGKKLTNVRAAAADDALVLPPAKPLTLEEALGFVASDELVEVTPERVRVRKAVLDAGARRRAAR
jgi:GTP-binding protein